MLLVLPDGTFTESMSYSSLSLGSFIMEGTFNKLTKFKKRFRAEGNFVNYFTPIFY